MTRFDIYGVPPHQAQEQHLTERPTEAQAKAYAENLTSFGYTKVRVQERQAAAPARVQVPAPATPEPPRRVEIPAEHVSAPHED